MTSGTPHPKAREADIALLLEGTFPYVSGGVSSWINQIVRAYPEYRYAIVFLGSRRSDYNGFKYELPANVVHFEEHFLYDDLSARGLPVARRGNEFAFAMATSLVECLRHGEADTAQTL